MDGSEEYTTTCLGFEQRLHDVERLRKRNFWDIKPTNKKYEIQELSELCSKEEWEKCKKSQGHDGFLPWQKFLEDAKSYLCQDGINNDSITFDYIKTSGALVVRLIVSYVSGERPEDLYPTLFRYRETNYNFTGSGIVIYTERSNERCRCFNCKTLAEKRDSTWNVYISTATHVAFNHKEATSTTSELFYDSETRTNIKRLFVQCVEQRSITGDSCILKCVTCDENLYHDLNELLTKQKQLYAALPLCERPTAVIISHPHGMYKHISWGLCQVDDTAQDQIFWMTSYKYKTTTCPGSSGAPVFILHTHNKERHNYVIAGDFPTHTGSDSDANYCGEHHEPTLMNEADVEKIRRECKKQNTQSKHSNSTGNSFEADLHHHSGRCHKTHVNYIKVNDLNLDHLPRCYRDVLVLDFIKTFACLSCQVKVKIKALGRQKSATCLTCQYPFYNTRGGDALCYATCTIVSVAKQVHDTCLCGKCQHSETPSKVWYIVRVKSSTQVVFNESEARQTQIVVGFDDDTSPGVSLDGLRVVCSDVKGDWLFLECVTCDVVLADELSSLLNRLYVLEKDIIMKYAHKEDVDKLTVIISYPHGGPKLVSVGQLTDKRVRETSYDNVTYTLTYTTNTCSGSSGAAVYVFGQKFPKISRRFITTHVHSDNLENGWNKSGYVVEDYVTTHVHNDDLENELNRSGYVVEDYNREPTNVGTSCNKTGFADTRNSKSKFKRFFKRALHIFGINY